MFKIGQKAVCITTRPFGQNLYNHSLYQLIVGELYTVERETSDGLLLKEVKSAHPTGEFCKRRFRPVDDSWTESILESVVKEMEYILT